ncbi:helix-turn-helix domain-containing protein [Paenibacillus apiarius]|uniref:helix-turn-helix domain-containing protein n=1 Tax=Paenibacillus apiarius TaxID=46240 RepID=UPI003B3A68D3
MQARDSGVTEPNTSVSASIQNCAVLPVIYSPIQYLTQIRIKEAKELLLASDATLEEIAIRVGYPDKYYFSRIFKKHTGTSPIQFRNRLGTGGIEPLDRFQCNLWKTDRDACFTLHNPIGSIHRLSAFYFLLTK